jgi:CheY-like chemotaxis protein
MEKNEFQNDVKDILNHLSDPAYLENHNLIELFYTGAETSLSGRIQAIRDLFLKTIDFLKPPDGTPLYAPEWRCYKILTLRYFQMKEWHVIEEELGLSQRQVQRDLKKGLDAFISILWDQYAIKKQDGSASPTNSRPIHEFFDQELIKEELKNWELTFDLVNLSQILEQALQLCNLFLSMDLKEKVEMMDVDQNLCVEIDQVLTKQGLYKILSIVGSNLDKLTVTIHSRKISDYFIELCFRFNIINIQTLEQWIIAQLFFTIQGLRVHLVEEDGTSLISIILPVEKQITCLVIDDVESVPRLIERMLGPYGIQVFGAENYNSALNIIQLLKPDFIMLDILMPKMDGWQMIKNLRSYPQLADIPVIICSVLYEPELSQSVNAAAYVRKPIDRLELIKTLQTLQLLKTGKNPDK